MPNFAGGPNFYYNPNARIAQAKFTADSYENLGQGIQQGVQMFDAIPKYMEQQHQERLKMLTDLVNTLGPVAAGQDVMKALEHEAGMGAIFPRRQSFNWESGQFNPQSDPNDPNSEIDLERMANDRQAQELKTKIEGQKEIEAMKSASEEKMAESLRRMQEQLSKNTLASEEKRTGMSNAAGITSSVLNANTALDNTAARVASKEANVAQIKNDITKAFINNQPKQALGLIATLPFDERRKYAMHAVTIPHHILPSPANPRRFAPFSRQGTIQDYANSLGIRIPGINGPASEEPMEEPSGAGFNPNDFLPGGVNGPPVYTNPNTSRSQVFPRRK